MSLPIEKIHLKKCEKDTSSYPGEILTMVDDGIRWMTMVVHGQPSNTMKTR